MKKYLSIICLLLLLPGLAFGFPPQPPPSEGASVSDEAYNTTTWNGVAAVAPSKNAVRDKVEALPGGHDAVTLDVNADAILSLAVQQIGLDTQAANIVFAGPASGAAAAPTFRSLVPADIPDISATYTTVESINTAAELEAVANLGAYASDILAATTKAGAATIIGVGTGDSPQFTGIELSHATENTLTASSGTLSIEGVPLQPAATTFSGYGISDTVGNLETALGGASLAQTDQTETVTGAWTLPNQKYTILTSVPGSPVTGVMYCFDNDTADPCDVDGLDDYCAFYDGADWVAFHKTNGTKFFQSIPVPTLKASELNDTSDPHDLTVDELKNTILTNSESTGADEWDFPARTEGWNFIFIKEADQNITLDPNGTENWYFRTSTAAYTANGAGVSIVNTTAGKSTISCFSTESAVYCTGDANWAQGS